MINEELMNCCQVQCRNKNLRQQHSLPRLVKPKSRRRNRGCFLLIRSKDICCTIETLFPTSFESSYKHLKTLNNYFKLKHTTKANKPIIQTPKHIHTDTNITPFPRLETEKLKGKSIKSSPQLAFINDLPPKKPKQRTIN